MFSIETWRVNEAGLVTASVDWPVTVGARITHNIVQYWRSSGVDAPDDAKREEYASSGRLLRTAYFPKWKKVFSASKRGDVWYPEESRIFDEVEKENSTLMLVRNIDLKELDASIFSKAWLESKSR